MMATQPEQIEARRSVTGAPVALLLLGLVVLLGLLWFLFLRGGPEEVIATPPVTTPTPAPEPEETADPNAGRKKEPLETFEVFAPKDPFRPLIAAIGSGTAAAPAAAPTADGGTGGTGAGPGTAPSGGSDISGDGGSSGGSQNV